MQRMIDLKSPRGQELLREVKNEGQYFQSHLFGIFENQKGPKNCGIHSSCLLMNAAYLGDANNDVDKKVDTTILPYREEKIFTYPETQRVKTQEGVTEGDGITLQEVGDLLRSHGNNVEIHHASDSSVDQFRSTLKEVLAFTDSSCGIIINYHMATLGQKPNFGHHSPLAGYHPEEDSVLLLDTWWDTQECWTNVEALFEAMNTIDSASGVTRGYCVFRHTQFNQVTK